MRDREESLGLCGEHRLLLTEVLDATGKDTAVRRAHVPKPPEVRLTEGTLPREPFAGNRPRSVAVTFTFNNLGQLQSHLGRVVEGLHARTVLPSAGVPKT